MSHRRCTFTQRDFYAMKAFFNNVPERGVGLYSNPVRTNAPPFVKLRAPEIEARVGALNAKLAAVNDQIAALTGKSFAGEEEWAQRVAASVVEWKPVPLLTANGGDQPPKVDTEAQTVEIPPQESRANSIKIKATLPAGRITALRFECGAVAAEASFLWSELQVRNRQPLKLRAVVAGDSLAVAEAAKLLDGNRKTRTTLAVKADHPAEAVFALEPAFARRMEELHAVAAGYASPGLTGNFASDFNDSAAVLTLRVAKRREGGSRVKNTPLPDLPPQGGREQGEPLGGKKTKLAAAAAAS